MAFRVTNNGMDQQFLFHNRYAREQEAQTLERLSTLKRVNRGSDAPEDYRHIRNTKTDISTNQAFKDVLEYTTHRFQMTEDALGGIRDALDEARTLALSGTSILHNAQERITVADQLVQLRLTIINRLNTQSEGEYLFSGTDVDVQPFPNPTTGTYSGNSDAIDVRISASDTLRINFNGDDIAFGTGGQGSADDILQTLSDLENAFRTNNSAAIDAALPLFNPLLDRINQTIGQLGARGQRLIFEQNHYSTFELDLQTVLSTLEDADLAEEAVKLDAVQGQLQAQLRSHGTVSRQNLFDFLG